MIDPNPRPRRPWLLAGPLLAGVAALALWRPWASEGSATPVPDASADAAGGGLPGEFVAVADTPDWHRIDDPERDGWETEAWQDAAKHELELVGHWVETLAEPSADEVGALAAPSAPIDPLVPANAELAYEDELLRIERSRRGDDTAPVDLASAVRTVLEAFEGAHEARYLIKPFHVEETGEGFLTRELVSFWARTDEWAAELNATWTTTWRERGEGQPPLLLELRVDEAEHVRARVPRLFTDVTRAAIGDDPCFERQLALGFVDWARRIPDRQYFALLGTPGLAVADVDGDGLEDVYLGQQFGLPNRLFLQQPDGTARDVAQAWGIDWLDDTRGVLLVDLDGDGDRDLAAATLGGVALARNEGTRFALQRVVPSADDLMSLAAADPDVDGDLDLFACAYLRNAELGQTPGAEFPGGGAGFVYHDANDGGRNAFLRNEGGFAFTDATVEVGLDANNRRYSFAASFEDYDDDGDLDLYVANDYGRNNLYRNDGTGRFVDVAGPAAAEDSASGMSVSWGDYDRDGRMDLYVSNMYSSAGNRVTYQEQFKSDASDEVKSRIQRFARGNTLLRNAGDGTFEDVSEAAGVTMGRWAWGSELVDVNDDGWQDVVVANGYMTTEDTGDL